VREKRGDGPFAFRLNTVGEGGGVRRGLWGQCPLNGQWQKFSQEYVIAKLSVVLNLKFRWAAF